MAEHRQETGAAGVEGRAVGEPLPTRIGQAVILHRGGDREEARNRLARLWEEAGEDGDPFHRCAIAHYLAGTQDDPAAGLEWDRRALAAAKAPAGDRAAVRALLPSLHLSLAAAHAGLGDLAAARHELERARGAVRGLPDDEYGAGVRAAIGDLARWLADAAGPSAQSP
ncbi:hypothetical protein ACLIYM_13675 [Streptomyces fenghuangensis]|uniref:Tetratricopeptide repeat protein n=1 Tax=Streptomyces chitinivorans TaxID=1257027 RepID=A0ABW7HYG8_9ACTN|nr:hypothetical protein [Streptomyces chitinivorans]MDH2410000.1 hypothetical protein [Streptomyces chitinivorans]